MITTEELVSFINHPQFKADLANECISICFSNNKHLSIDELGNVIEKNNNSSSEYEIVNPSAVIEFYKESIIEKINDCVDYGETYFLNELKNKVNLLEDIQDYCFSREESEAEFEREITYSNKSNLDLQEGFWTSTDGYKTKVHISTNSISDDYVRLITSYENRDDEEKDYIDNLIATNPNESYITISINPTTKEIEFTLNGIYHSNLINQLKYDYKFQLIKDLSKLLYNVDTIDNSTTNEYKQQIGSNFEKYKEIVDSVIVERLTDSIGDIIKDDFYTSDEEHDCRYYCDFFGEHLDLYQDYDKNINYKIGLVFNKKRECVDYFIDRIIDGNVDYDVHQELTPYNKEIFRIAENKIKNLVLQKFHTQELYNISKYIDWSGFTGENFNKFKNELLTGNEKPDWKGSINVGSVSFEITQYEKTEENPCLDYKVFILGEDNGYEYDGKDDDTIPYAFYEGNQFAINMITDNTYEEFKNKFTELIINDIKEKNIQNSEHVKKEMMRPTINWSNYETAKKLYLDKIIEKIEWKNFSKESFELLKKEILSGDVEEGFKGSINCGALSIEFHQHDKEYDFMDFDYYILGEDGEGENHNVPYCYETGETIYHQLIKENDYKTFKKDFTNILSKEIEKHHFLKEATKYKTIDWTDEIEVKNFYLEKLNGKEFFKTETLSNANELKFIINSLEPALDFKKSDAEIVLDYLVGGEYLSFENNTLKYKGDDGKTYGENLFDVLKYIEANIEERIENIYMNMELGFIYDEDQEYLEIFEKQVLPSIQNKYNFLRLKETFIDKSSDMAFNGLDKANFDELYLDCKNSFPSKTDEELLVEAASRMIMSNVNDFGYFSVQNYDELFDKEDGADYRFTLCEAAAKELLDSKISDFSQVEEYIKNQSKEVFKNECLKELEKQTFLDDVEKIVDLSIDSLDKDDYLDTYSYVTEEEYDRTKYLFDNFYKIENQTGSIDLKALYDSKESIDNVVTLENGAEIRKVIELDESEERVYYDLYDKDVCSICDGENYEVKAVIDGTYYLKGLDSEYEDFGFALSTEEYLIATQKLGLLIENQILDINVWEETYDCGLLNDEIAEKLFNNYKEAEGYNDVIHIFAEKNEDGSFEYHLDRHNPETGEWKECLLDSDIPQILKDYLQKEIELFETKNKDLEQIKPQFITNLIENNRVFDRYELTIQNDNELLKQMNLNSELLNHTFIFDITSTMGRDKELSRAFIRKELLDGTKAEENIDLDMIPPKLQDKLQDWFKKESQGRDLHIMEDVYYNLADKICQAAYEASASGFNYSFNFDEIATLADRDIEWVKLHIEKIGEALATYHNDELLLDFNPSENINLEENQIEFNFCSVGEDANELFKFVEGRWERKSNRELEADGYIIPVDIKYSFTYKPNQNVAEEKQLLMDSICDLFIEGTESVEQKTNSLPGGKFNIEFILRHDFAIEPGTDYFNLNFDSINNKILYEMNNIIKNNEKLHCFTIDSIESFIPEEFHIRKNLVLINDETIEDFSKTPKEYLKELNPGMVFFAGSSMWREEERFTSDKNNFFEIMEKYPAIKNYVEKKWDLLKEKRLQHEKEVEVLWNKGIFLFKDTKYWEDILTETSADSKENENLILSKLHSKFRQEIVDKFNPNENINWENESWNYICETMQRKSLDYDYSVNYNNGLTSKDLQDFIANDFITIKMNLHDKEMESLWEELEDIPFIEDEDGRLILDSDEPWHNFEPGTTKKEIWHYFDRNHSKGINYLVNEYESKTKELQEQSKKEDELNDLTQEEQESQMYKKIYTKDSSGDEEWKEYDDKGNEIHFKNSDGHESWKEYDDKGNVIHFKHSNGLERWTDYDEKGNAIHSKTSDGEEYWKDYDDKGNLIHYKDSSGDEYWNEYDEKGNVIHFKNSDEFEVWYEYDDKGNVIYYKNSDDVEEWTEYDDKGNEIHFKDSDGYERWYEYDDKGNEIHFKTSNGYEEWTEYDEKGNVIHFKKSDGVERWAEYNEKGNVIHSKNSHGFETWTEYDEKENVIHYKNSRGFESWSTVEYVSKEQYIQEIIEGISKEKTNTENDFRNMLFEKMKTAKDPFVATFRIFEELKQKNDTERIKQFNKYLEDNNCKTKEGYEKFFIEIIGLSKKAPKQSIRKERFEHNMYER